MKSSESETLETINPDYSGNIFMLQSPFYALLSIFIPVSVFAAMLPSLAFLAEMLIPVPRTLWLCSALLSGLVASLYWAVIKKSKADHTAANIRGAFLIIIVVYCIGSLLRPGVSIGQRFIPSMYNLPSAAIAVLIWFPVLKVKRVFEGQELFVSYIGIYEGEKLRQIMLQHSGLMSEADEDTKRLIARYRGFFLLPFGAFLICSFVGMPFSPGLAVLFAVFFISGVFIIGFLNFLRREYAFAAEGLVSGSRPKALVTGTIMVLSSTFLGFLFSSNNSLLSFEMIVDLFRRFLAFLGSLFTNNGEAPPLEEIPRDMLGPPPGGLNDEFMQLVQEGGGTSAFWDYAQYFALGAVAILFIWFIINPLLNRSVKLKDIKTLPKKIFLGLKAFLKSFILGLKVIIYSLKQGSGGRKIPDSAALRSLEESILEGYSAAKKRDLRRSISLFARLIYWGQETLHIAWKPSYAPLEYCRLLFTCVKSPMSDNAKPDVDTSAQADAGTNVSAQDILRSGELFEKALYSAFPLSHKEGDEFKTLVETITA